MTQKLEPISLSSRVQQSGVALVTLIVFVATALIITSAAVIIAAANAQASSIVEISEVTLSMAETGVDNAILRLLRNPNYTGETITLNDGSTVITVTGTTSKTITAVATKSTVRRSVRAAGTYQNNRFVLTTWQEI